VEFGDDYQSGPERRRPKSCRHFNAVKQAELQSPLCYLQVNCSLRGVLLLD
jgi:hypothetical protein